MATSTPNLNLILPDYSDKADISVLNDNFQKIDEYCANGGVSNEELQNAVKAANAWANATASAESVPADNEADVNLTEGDNSKNLHFSIPRGQPGVLISETEPTDPNVKVWIKPDGEPNELEQLKSEVSSLKDQIVDMTTGDSVTTTDEYSGVLVEVDCIEGAKIDISGEVAESKTLYHCGKNLIPAYDGEDTTRNGVKVVKNLDGTITLSGKATTQAYFDLPTFCLPAGDFTMIPVGFPSMSGPMACVIQSLDGSITKSVSMTGGLNPFTLEKATSFSGYINVRTAFTGEETTVGVMIVKGHIYPACDYEAPTINAITGALPVTLDAYKGINTVYTGYDDLLNVAVTETVPADKNYSNFDPSPYGLPMLYLSGDTSLMTKDYAVDLSYEYGSMRGKASVKWQGSSSIVYDKKNYTIKFDRAFEAKTGWGAQKKYCLKANWIDASHSRNVVSAILWGQIVKSRTTVPAELANLVNGGAIDGFPCIVMLNGNFHGLYTWNIPKDGWMLGMGSGENEAIVCAEGNSANYAIEGFKQTVSEWGTGFELEHATTDTYEKKAALMASLNNLITACIISDGSNLDDIGMMVDWDSAIDWMIYVMLIQGMDNITKNYLLHTFDGVKWYFTGYDMDGTWGNNWDGKAWLSPIGQPHTYHMADKHKLFDLIVKYKKDELKTRYSKLRSNLLSESNVYSTFASFIAQIQSEVYAEERKRWKTIPSTTINDFHQIVYWYSMRVKMLDDHIGSI